MGLALWKTVRRFLKKLKIELSYDSAILLLSICPEERSQYIEETSAPHVYCGIIQSPGWGTTSVSKCPPVSECVKKCERERVCLWAYTHAHIHM